MVPRPPNPSEIAREALRQLAQRRLAPTPDNYSRMYHEIATPGTRPEVLSATTMLQELAAEVLRQPGEVPREAMALERAVSLAAWPETKTALLRLVGARAPTATPSWGPLLRELLNQWEARTPGLTRGKKREMLEHVIAASSGTPEVLYTRLRGLVRGWSETVAPPSEPGEPASPSPAIAADLDVPSARETALTFSTEIRPERDAVPLVCELLAQTLTYGVVERLGYNPELVHEAQLLAAEARSANSPAAIADLGQKLKQFWVALEIRGEDQLGVQQGLLRLLHILVGNVAELVSGEDWLAGQMKVVEEMTARPLAQTDIAHLERSLREIVFKQGTLKHSLDEAKEALKSMVSTFIDRLGTMADSTGDYHDRIAGYASKIESATDLAEISDIIGAVMQDTRGVQFNLQRSRDDLLQTQEKVNEYQHRVSQLERELATVSERMHEDHLTALPNRRGLARAFESEAARSERRDEPLSLAVLDIDNFKNVNDTLGHQAGDLALVHLARVVRQALRPSDVIARFGGEEFVILLSDTRVDEAVKVMTRVQRELTKRFFLHNNEKVLITFSAGVAQRVTGESQDDLVERADRALYRAKEAGKNRVFAA
ncbi:MAG: diguanylate cyclase [Betaproteobacteria bacterium]|nr:diguanylate cyclase [Betaproteobacteria bacterium]